MTEQKLETNLSQSQLDQLAKLITFIEDDDGNLHIRDVLGSVDGSVWGDVGGDVYGDVVGNVEGDVYGNVGGNIWGKVWGLLGQNTYLWRYK
jgi:hypothetical protein